MASNAIVEALDLWRTFAPARDTPAVSGMSLTVGAGEWVAVMGPSGCGKSTLLHLLGGLDRPDSGTVRVGCELMSRGSESRRARLRRRHIGYVFQQYNLVPELTVAGNIELPLILNGVSRHGAHARAGELLAALDVVDCGRAAPSTLSGGQQQRVAVARALAARPAVVLADEPTGALDSASSALVIEAFREAHRRGQAIVMVTHDAHVAAAADRLVQMRDGAAVRASAA